MEAAANQKRCRWLAIAGLSLLVILGAWLRLHHLDEASVTHVEMYVPGIRMPRGISVPGERLTLAKTITGTFSSDTHPPAFYVLMWAWTKCFGAGASSIRLPAALLGIACIPLIFRLGTLTRQWTAAWIAAALLAVNGHQIFWSQIARMFTLACCLGLLATILLLRIAKDPRASRSLGFLYVLALLAGVASHVFFWAILGTHILWTLLNAWGSQRPFPAAAKLQFLALILGSPFLAFAAYQSGNELAALSSSIFVYAREFLQFAFAFPLVGFSSGVYPLDSQAPLVDDPHLSLARWLFFLVSLVFFCAGIAGMRKSEDESLGETRGPSPRAWWLASALAACAILGFVFMAKAFAKPHPNPTLRVTEIMAVAPFALATLATLLHKNWRRITAWRIAFLESRFIAGDQALVLALAVVPFAALAVASRFKPMFNERGMLLLGPYMLLVLAWGIAHVGRNRIVVAVLLVLLCATEYSGFRQYRRMSAGRADYKAFAAALAPRIDESDLVFLAPSWYATPLFYYVHSGWDRFVGSDYEAACRRDPRASVWVLTFPNYEQPYYEQEVPPEIQEALRNYRPVETVNAPDARAVLYSPENP